MCDNLLYVKLSGGEVIYQCNYCSSTYDVGDSSEPIVETDYRDDRAKYHHLLTPLLHEDPTLPRVDTVPCPNKGCTRAPRQKGRVLYVKYDALNLRFLYSCEHCKAFWGPEELGVHVPPAASAAGEEAGGPE